MTPSHRARLIATYIERYASDSPSSLSLGKNEDEPTFWAYSELAELVHKKPSEAFDIVLGILASTDDESVLDNLAAGPLEELIQFHGLLIIDLIEHEAIRNPSFMALLRGVWKAGSEDVWRRIEALIRPH
jgi:hypothetical protein